MLRPEERQLLLQMRTKKEEIQEEEEGDIYTEQGIMIVLEDDAISSEEQAFMLGYLSS